jgi:toxin ParE1/3/4
VKPLQISEPAALELSEAVRWYEERRPGWGGRLFDAVTHAFDLIESLPEIGAVRHGRLPARQLTVRGFPYVVIYRVRTRDLYVVAVAHTSRRPGYWLPRI